jgi:trimethylamine corrinoid protein
MPHETLVKLKEALLTYDPDVVAAAAGQVLERKIDPLEAIAVLTDTIREIGEKFARLEIFLPQLMLSGEAMKAGMAILEQGLRSAGREVPNAGTVVMGTVKGDIHDVGKTLVGSLLTASGFKIYDIGIDAPVDKFLQKAEEVKADVIGMSSLITSCRFYQKELIRRLCDAGIRDRYYVIVGGGSITPDWAREIGADGYADYASGAVELCKYLMSERPRQPLPEPVVF